MTVQENSSSNILSIRPFQFHPTQRVWITNEDIYLREHYKRLSVKEIAQYLRRSQSAVRTRAHILGLKKITYIPWTEEEHKYLRVAYPTGDVMEIARKLNRTISAIRRKAFSLGLEKSPRKRPKKLKRMKPREEPWKDDQLTFLKQQFSQMSLDEMSQRLQRPESEIRSKLRQIFPVSTRRPLFNKLLTAEVDKLMISGISTQFLQHIKDRALFIGQKWIQHPKAVCMRLIGFRLYFKGIITLAYNQIMGTDDILYQTEQMQIYRRKYRLQQDLYGDDQE